MIKPGSIAAIALANCGVLHFQPTRSELDLQRSLGLTNTGDWGPFDRLAAENLADEGEASASAPRSPEDDADA